MKSKTPSKDNETYAQASSKALGEDVYRILRHQHKNDKKMHTRPIFKLEFPSAEGEATQH